MEEVWCIVIDQQWPRGSFHAGFSEFLAVRGGGQWVAGVLSDFEMQDPSNRLELGCSNFKNGK